MLDILYQNGFKIQWFSIFLIKKKETQDIKS